MKKSFFSFIKDQRTPVKPVITADLSGKTVIVTGANTGLGYEAAKHFARMNPAKLILACRNKQKGEAAVARLKDETSFNNAELWLLDLAKFSSVIQFADKFERECERLDILVANAAIAPTGFTEAEAGWEESFQVNNLSTSLLCVLLVPRMIETARDFGTHPRMVVVSSEMHYWTKLDQAVLDSPSPMKTFGSREYCTPSVISTRYQDTKLLNVFFTRSLASVLKNTPIIVDCVNPGFCYSELRRSLRSIVAIGAAVMEKLLAHTSEEGSRQLVWAALGVPTNSKGTQALDLLRGAYVSLESVEEPSDYVIGKEGQVRQDRLWESLITELSKIDPRVKDIVRDY